MIWAGSDEHNRLFKHAAYTSDINNIDHESSRTSKEVAVLEERLKKKLSGVIKRMQEDDIADIGTLRNKYGDEVKAIIASTVQAVFLEALKYTDRFNEGGVILSAEDVNKINDTARKYTDRFWLKANEIINRNTTLLNENNYEERNPLNVTNQLALLASNLTLGLLSQTTVDKLQGLGDPEIKLVWITALDERVCPICRPLHAREWDINDYNILYPGPEDSHHNCRCRLLIKYKGEIYDN